MDSTALGKALITLGLVIAVIGGFLIFRDRIPFLGRLGRLPGDIVVEKENVRVYFPIVTSIVLSVLLSLVMWLLRSKSN